MLRAFVLASFVALAALPAASSGAAGPEPVLPGWLSERLALEGVDLAGVTLERTLIADGERTTFVLPLSALPREDPFGEAAVAPPGAPDALVGELLLHFMLQLARCDGYGAQEVAAGISSIQDASWDLGTHLALGPLAGGVAASTSGDPVANAVVIASADTGMSLAAGDLAITEDRITIFGICLATIGTMSGTGAWVFS